MTASEGRPIRVAVIDDDSKLLEGLQCILQSARGISCAGAWRSVEEAWSALAKARPDVLLLDVQLPGVQGSLAARELRDRFPSMAILILTAFADSDKVFTSIRNGASGYLLKTARTAQLLDAIRAVHAGGSPISPEIARQMVEFFQPQHAPPDEQREVTPQERRLLALLAEGYNYESAAVQMGVSINTVRNHVRGIYEKLQVHTKSEAVAKALRTGIVE